MAALRKIQNTSPDLAQRTQAAAAADLVEQWLFDVRLVLWQRRRWAEQEMGRAEHERRFFDAMEHLAAMRAYDFALSTLDDS